jgi:hypothetical protein
MNKIWISICLMLSLMGCVLALDGSSLEMRPGQATSEAPINYGIGQSWVGSNPPPSDTSVSQYSQYYSMTTGSVPGTHIVAPKQYQISGNIPATVYFSNQQQAVPYDQYQSYATYTGGNSLWIQGSTSWTQYVTIPQGAFLSLIATSSTGGNGNLYEIYPDGRLLANRYYYFPGYNQIGFWADTVGQHVLLFVINGQVSNPILINVVNYQPLVYQQPIYSQPIYVSPIYYHQTDEFDFHHRPHIENVSPWGH